MGVLMIKCPETGRAISTGLAFTPPGFECTPVFFSTSYCPFCAAEHEWFARDAWVEPDRDYSSDARSGSDQVGTEAAALAPR